MYHNNVKNQFLYSKQKSILKKNVSKIVDKIITREENSSVAWEDAVLEEETCRRGESRPMSVRESRQGDGEGVVKGG